jgi:hypothetical protein
MKKSFVIFVLLLAYMPTFAQSWQWGKRGGSADMFSVSGSDETVIDMATDKNGNVYILSNVGTTALNVDGHTKIGFGNQDILLSSFTCNGIYRWSKVVGANGIDYPTSIGTDTVGGVYVTGTVDLTAGTANGNIDADSALGITNKSFFLLKYDTAGVYQWWRMPQADTVTGSAVSVTGALDMSVDGSGNVYCLCLLPTGAFANGAFVVTVSGVYMLKYNKNGVFQSGFQMQITGTYISPLYTHMTRDAHNGRFYVSGTLQSGSTLSMGGNPVNHPMYIGSFKSTG